MILPSESDLIYPLCGVYFYVLLGALIRDRDRCFGENRNLLTFFCLIIKLIKNLDF